MLRSRLCLCAALLLCGSAAAQHPDEAYYPYDAAPEERMPVLVPDTALFYRAVQQAEDLYGALTDYNLSFVASKRRGLERPAEGMDLHGIALPLRYAAGLRLLGLDETRRAGLAMAQGRIGGADGIRAFSLADAQCPAAHRVAVNFTDRNYLARVRYAARRPLGRGWEAAVAGDLRTGRDLHVEGVFTHSLSLGLCARKRWGESGELALLVALPGGMRGVRAASTAEAFSLRDDPLYNPAWGFQRGRVRNARIRREWLPLAVAIGRVRLTRATLLEAGAALQAGVEKYSALGWYDARTPLPDNYRYLPGYTGDRETERAWRTNDTRRTQIDWDELWQQNRMAGRAVYALEDRVTGLCDLQGTLALTTEADERLTLEYGLSLRRRAERAYKRMRDLMGAPCLVDIDQYLVDDETFGNRLQNDLRHPNRRIGAGDRFGYDYDLIRTEAAVRLHATYRADRLRAEFGVEAGEAAVRRRGRFEKELFPGSGSYGLSRRMRFTPFAVKGSVGWAFSPRSYLEALFFAGAEAPACEDLFLQPQYNNRTIDTPTTQRIEAAEANYRFQGRKLSLQLALFVVSVRDGVRTLRYYDDLASTFCDLAATGIGTLHYGAEAAAEWRVSYRWTLSLAASAGRYAFSRNPRITVYADADNTVVDTRSESHLGDCSVGGAPQLAAVASVAWFGPKGWGLRAAANYAGRRYVEPALLRRTARVARQAAGSREAFAAFTVQERLDDAVTADASLFKSFYFGRSRLTAALLLRNLLDLRRAFYNGYESLRVGRRRSGDAYVYAPHATRYTSVYPRSFYLTVSYNF